MTTFLLVLLMAVCAHAQFDVFGRNYERTATGDAVDKASMKLLKEIYSASSDKNVISSPLGVWMLLSLYAAGAEGPVRDEIVRGLYFKDYETLFSSYSNLGESFSTLDPSYLVLANKVCVSSNYNIQDNFRSTAELNYRSEVDKVDFSDPKLAASVINEWSNNKTKGHIKEPVNEDDFSADTAAALFNVIFFQGHWSVPFNATETEDKDFHVDSSTTVKKPTMKLTRPLFFTDSEALGAKLVELPYQEKDFRMVVIVPNEVEGLSSVLNKVAEKGVLADVFELNPTHQVVNLEIPKFEVTSKHDFNNILPKVGVSRIFNTAVNGIVVGQPVVVSKVFQEALVKVDEEGATATAFTGAVIVPMSSLSEPPPPMDLKVDRPFIYAILKNDIILFVGTYAH